MKPNVRRQKLVAALQSKTPGSGDIYYRAESVFPGGAVGAGPHQNPWPIYMERGENAFMWDVDGNRYIDCSQGSGSLIFGHNHPYIQSMMQSQTTKGVMHSGSSPLQVSAAEKLTKIFRCTEKIVFCNSGTEAVHKSIMLARAATQKNKIAKFEGCYHGTYDQSCISVTRFSENENPPSPMAMIAGVPQRALDDILILPFNHRSAFDLIEKQSGELAAVIVEPIATIGLFSMSKEFLSELRELTQKKGILLIFDEVLTGFRVGSGGCQNYFNITPDIAAYGKALGGGTPVGALGCKDNLLHKLVNASPPLRLGGTFSGNPLSMAATNATLDLCLDTSAFSFDLLASKCAFFSNTLNQKSAAANLPVHVSHIGSMFFIHIQNTDPEYPRDLMKNDMKKLDELNLQLRINGVYAENAHTSFFSFAHTDTIVDQLIDIFFHCITECFRTDA